MMPQNKQPPLDIGDVIKTHPKEGFWGCAVVLNTHPKCKQFNPFCLIGITPVIFRRDYAWTDLADIKLSILQFDRGIRLVAGGLTQYRRETCIGWYDARPHPDLPTIGRVSAGKVFSGPVHFEIGDATNGKWPLCGRITRDLGREAVIAWRREHDAAKLACEEAACDKAHDKLMARLKREEKAKRDARKRKRV